MIVVGLDDFLHFSENLVLLLRILVIGILDVGGEKFLKEIGSTDRWIQWIELWNGYFTNGSLFFSGILRFFQWWDTIMIDEAVLFFRVFLLRTNHIKKKRGGDEKFRVSIPHLSVIHR